MDRYNLSLYSVNSALDSLEKEGVVERRPWSGIYVGLKKAAPCHIEFHAPLFLQRGLDAKEFSLGHAVAVAGWSMGVRRHPLGIDDPASLPDPAASAHVVALEFVDLRRTFFNLLLKKQLPLVVMGRQADTSLDMVMISDHEAIGLLVRHFLSLGHRRLAVLVNEPDEHDTRRRREIFADVFSSFGLGYPQFIECGTRPGEMSAIRAYETLLAHLSRRGPIPFTALISISPAGAVGALRAFVDAGLRVPRDCSVASLGMNPENLLQRPSITDAGVESSVWGEAVVGILRRRFQGEAGGPIHAEIQPQLTIRESSGPVPRA